MRFHRLRNLFNSATFLSTRERMIREHARWLTQAVRRPGRYPRIPVRKVADGGFARLMASREGRAVADSWWFEALERVD